MRDDDFESLVEWCQSIEVPEDEIETMDSADLAVILKKENSIIGTAEGDTVKKGDAFENPLDRRSYYQVLEVEKDRLYVELISIS